MRFGHIELRVTDPLRSLAFYRDVLGFELVNNQEDRFIWMRLGTTELLLRPGHGGDGAPTFDAAATNLAFYTDDLRGKQTALEDRGLTFEGDDAGCPIFRDPDGHWFQLVGME